MINSANDDLEHGIAGGLACPVNIANDATTVYVGSATQLTWTSADDAPVVFESSNPEVATVDAKGLVTGVSEGTATITIKNATNENITDSVIVTVEEVPEVKTITLTPSATPIDEIYGGQNKTYTATVYNGTTPTDASVEWALYSDDQVSSTTLAAITAQDGTTCTIKANSNQQYGYVQLKCSLADDPSVFVWQRIRIRSLF
ncbi:Ig-like domain-containing protein [Paenibacillus cisolokensis]|uniref:Ig-like domain-containing protein n=1 Tax=Paenibacillus cisolokensis TaxID=1658519 RepID=UPI001BD0CF8B|nr:Ig-like domain-containing protein [Paenibacillus cisolokensis]